MLLAKKPSGPWSLDSICWCFRGKHGLLLLISLILIIKTCNGTVTKKNELPLLGYVWLRDIDGETHVFQENVKKNVHFTWLGVLT